MYKHFSKRFITVFVMMVFLNIILSQVLMRIYEHNPLREVVKEHHTSSAIYGSLLNDHEFEYALSQILYTEPEIIALGSSRVLPFRKEFFSTKFVSAGRAVTQIKEAEMFVDRLNEMESIPKTILFGLDFWWFHEDYAKRNISMRHSQTEGDFASNKLRSILNHIIQGRLDVVDVWQKIMFDTESEKYRKYNEFHSMGLSALKNFSGLRKDGSYFYGNIISGHRESPDKQFQSTLTRINNGTDKFRYGSKINEQAWESLLIFIKKARANNIDVVFFTPPLSSKVFNLITSKADNYRYINRLTKRFEKESMFFNFHDPQILNTNDCEFIDGFHGGEVTYARLLTSINERVLLPLSKNINKYINLNKGKALIKLNDIERSRAFSEIDFLGLGCQK